MDDSASLHRCVAWRRCTRIKVDGMIQHRCRRSRWRCVGGSMAARTTVKWLHRCIAWRWYTRLRVDWMIQHHCRRSHWRWLGGSMAAGILSVAQLHTGTHNGGRGDDCRIVGNFPSCFTSVAKQLHSTASERVRVISRTGMVHDYRVAVVWALFLCLCVVTVAVCMFSSSDPRALFSNNNL